MMMMIMMMMVVVVMMMMVVVVVVSWTGKGQRTQTHTRTHAHTHAHPLELFPVFHQDLALHLHNTNLLLQVMAHGLTPKRHNVKPTTHNTTFEPGERDASRTNNQTRNPTPPFHTHARTIKH